MWSSEIPDQSLRTVPLIVLILTDDLHCKSQGISENGLVYIINSSDHKRHTHPTKMGAG